MSPPLTHGPTLTPEVPLPRPECRVEPPAHRDPFDVAEKPGFKGVDVYPRQGHGRTGPTTL